MHGERYSYPEENYQGTSKPMEIICNIHGAFSIHLHHHLRGRGCYNCALEQGKAKRKSYGEEEFSNLLREQYGDDLIPVGEYNPGAPTIRCTIHGITFSKPSTMLLDRGQGCPRCSGKKRMLPYEIFLERARAIHGGKYAYGGESTYGGFRGSVNVICPIHGSFTASVKQHLDKGGKCPSCGRGSSRSRTTFQGFVEKARTLHGERYTYVEESYTKSSDPVEIICPEHGCFTQIGGRHLLGQGCPTCCRVASSGERVVMRTLEERGITYTREKTFPGLRGIGGGSLRFDFFLPEYGALIEFDGEQHHAPTGFYGAITKEEQMENLRVLQVNDRIKDEWAITEGYPLLRLTDVGSVPEEMRMFLEQLKP